MNKRIYFISDIHLGAKVIEDKKSHEKKVVDWLNHVSNDAAKIIFLGDVFDFWFEYKTVVPKGFVRFFGKVSELIDKGVEIHFFTGNHDIWAFEYFEKEIGMIVHHQPLEVNWLGKKFYLAHGDGLYDNDKGFKFISKLFHSPFFQSVFSAVPSTMGQKFGYKWSEQSRIKVMKSDNSFKGEDKENLVRYSKKILETTTYDYLIYGHRHLDLKLQLSKKSQMIILGDFYSIFSYGVFDGIDFNLEYF